MGLEGYDWVDRFIDKQEHHDLGRGRSLIENHNIRMQIMMYGEEALLAFDLHHVLDYICSKLNPRRAAKEEAFSQIAYETREMHPLVRTSVIGERMRELKGKIETAEEVSRNVVIRDLFEFMKRVNIHPEVQSFVTQNLHEILDELSNYVKVKAWINQEAEQISEEEKKRKPRTGENNKTMISLEEAEELIGRIGGIRRRRAVWFMR